MKRNSLRYHIIERLLQNGSVTRPALSAETKTRAATVFEIVGELKNEGVVAEPDRQGRRSGRRASELTIRPELLFTAGIELRLDRTVGVAADAAGNVISAVSLDAGDRHSIADCRREISEVLSRLRSDTGKAWQLLKGIGMADPGLVDIGKGISLRAVNLPWWENTPTGQWLSEENGVRAGLWPECMVKTFMEYHTRRAGLSGSLFHIGLDRGIGGGFIKNGECFIGDTNRAMEIGHIIVSPGGPLCQCGNRGCLEAVAGEAGIRRRIQEALVSGVDTSLNLKDFSLKEFTRLVGRDKTATVIAEEISEAIGRALSVVITLLNPSNIVISGDLAALGDLMLTTVNRSLAMSCFAGSLRELEIGLSILKPEDTAYGAALLMRNELLMEYA